MKPNRQKKQKSAQNEVKVPRLKLPSNSPVDKSANLQLVPPLDLSNKASAEIKNKSAKNSARKKMRSDAR